MNRSLPGHREDGSIPSSGNSLCTACAKVWRCKCLGESQRHQDTDKDENLKERERERIEEMAARHREKETNSEKQRDV